VRVIIGSFVRESDMQSFEYEASFEHVGDEVAWVARVTSDGAFRGRPQGMIGYVGPLSDETIEEQVRQLVEASIRDRVSVG
jgi:hypothetical protein